MNTTPKEIREYLTEEGESPFRKWLKSLRDANARAKIRVRLNKIRLGNLGDCKSVGSGVSELRIDYGPGYRVYFGQDENEIIILLYGGDKKRQQKDIETAISYWQDYKRRKDG